MRRALVTGLTGQDGSYLSEKLLETEWEVHALVRNTAKETSGIDRRIILHHGDLCDLVATRSAVDSVEPDVIFNLGGMSSVASSWNDPVGVSRTNGSAVTSMLAAALDLQQKSKRPVRFVQASSSEIFGEPTESPQTEQTPLAPLNPYGAAKAYAHTMTKIYRSRGLLASNAIFFNHESPRRQESFVTRKITMGVARIAAGKADTLVLGNLDAKRDWGWAPDYVNALLLIAEADQANDFVIATGKVHSVREFVNSAFSAVGISDWVPYVKIDPNFIRPADVKEMCGDASLAMHLLDWQPSIAFEDIVARMTLHDLELVSATQS